MTDTKTLRALAEKAKKYYFNKHRMLEFYAAASPDVVLSILDERDTAHMDGYECGKQEARDAAHAEIDSLHYRVRQLDAMYMELLKQVANGMAIQPRPPMYLNIDTHALIKERDADREAMRVALAAMHSVTMRCGGFHHDKKDMHHHSDVCKPLIRFEVAINALRARMVDV